MSRARIGLGLGCAAVVLVLGLGVRGGLLGVRAAEAIDLSGVAQEQRLWVVFKDSLREEDRQLRQYGEA